MYSTSGRDSNNIGTGGLPLQGGNTNETTAAYAFYVVGVSKMCRREGDPEEMMTLVPPLVVT